MANLLKIVVTDSGGVEHEFPEMPGEVENVFTRYIDGEDTKGWVRVETRTFANNPIFESNSFADFYQPRRVDLIFGRYE